MAGDDVQQKARLRAAILRHVERNAFSADTAKGILACWLPETDFEDAARHIDPVLKELWPSAGSFPRRCPAATPFTARI
jgi:hypothetical protein